MPNSSNRHDEAGRSALSSPVLLAGVFFLSCSVFLLYTLVLDEDYLGPKTELLRESAALIAAPALVGLALVALAVKRSRQR